MDTSPLRGKWDKATDVTIWGTAVFHLGGQRWPKCSPLKHREQVTWSDPTIRRGSKGRRLLMPQLESYSSAFYGPDRHVGQDSATRELLTPSPGIKSQERAVILVPQHKQRKQRPLRKSVQTFHWPYQKHRMLPSGVGHENCYSILVAL